MSFLCTVLSEKNLSERKHIMSQSIKSFILPLAMLIGGVFYGFFSQIAVAIPYFIFAMLFLTFCRLSPREVRLHRLHAVLLLIQIGGGLALYYALAFLNVTVAEGVFMCVLAPTAMAATVITGMLGGNAGFMATYTLISNVGMAVLAPAVFALLGKQEGLTFAQTFLYVCRQLAPMLVLPLAVAWGLRWIAPKVHQAIAAKSHLTFYIWALSLTSITGRTVRFLIEQPNPDYRTETVIALLALVVCLAQFKSGKALGSRWGDRIATGQAMGQKNTILAIWMAQSYLNPIASVGPASYVLWQNIVNSYQIWLKGHRERQALKKNAEEAKNLARKKNNV